MNKMKKISGLLTLLFILVGCANDQNSNGDSYGSGYYYTDSWWYDDYLFYSYHNYPSCCGNNDEWQESITQWWKSLDSDQQQNIKDKVSNWIDEDGKPDIDTLKQDFKQRWQGLPENKKQELKQRKQNILEQKSDPKISTQQKEKLQKKWQSNQRPTLKRADKTIKQPNLKTRQQRQIKPRVTRPPSKPNISRFKK